VGGGSGGRSGRPWPAPGPGWRWRPWIAAGDADPLSGRFLHALDDLDELLADADRIVAEDLLTVRLRRWGEG
jgi:hypothetical protein